MAPRLMADVDKIKNLGRIPIDEGVLTVQALQKKYRKEEVYKTKDRSRNLRG